MRRSVFILLFATTAYGQHRVRAVNPVVAPPLRAGTDTAVGQTRLTSSDAGNGPGMIATSGSETLVVWGHGVQDQFSTLEYAFLGDPLPRILDPNNGCCGSLEVVFDGTNYVVRSGQTVFRLDRRGTVLSTQYVGELLAIASDRHTLAYVLLDGYQGGDLWVGSHKTHFTDNIGYPTIAANGNGYLLAWREHDHDMAQPFSSDGTPLAPAVALGIYGTTNKAVWTGHDYLVLDNQDGDIGTDPHVRGVHVGLDGSASKPVDFIDGKVIALAAASDGSTTNIAWTEYPSSATFAAKIVGDTITARNMLDPGTGQYISAFSLPTLTAYNGKFAAAQQKLSVLGNRAVSGDDVYALTFSASETLTADLIASRAQRMSTQAPAQFEPAAAATMASTAIVWRESNAIWMSIDGRTAAPVSASTTPQVTPAIAANGVDFFVTWVEGSDVRMARVDASGRASPASTVGSGTDPAIACGATDCVVSFISGYNIGTRRVAPNGTPLGVPVISPMDPFTQLAMEQTIGWNGHDYLEVWRGRRGAVFAANAESAGLTNIHKIGGGDHLHMASNGHDTVVVVDGGGYRLNAAGAVVESFGFDGSDATIAWTGREFLATFIAPATSFDTRVTLFAMRLGVDRAPVPIDSNAAGYFAAIDTIPASASRGDGTATVVYGRLRPEPPYMSAMRLFSRTVSD